jgi:hypothetical protein
MAMTITNDVDVQYDISYGIYTIERLPKGARRTPKWDLHSTAKDRDTAERHAKTLAAQPYFDHIEVQEFRVCPQTKDRIVKKVKSYSRKSSRLWGACFIIAACLVAILALI